MSPGRSEAPRELRWAWMAIAVAGVFLYIAEQRTAKKIREVGERAGAAVTVSELRGDAIKRLRDAYETEIGRLHYELDGPWDEDLAAMAEFAADAGEGLTEEIDPESRSPSE